MKMIDKRDIMEALGLAKEEKEDRFMFGMLLGVGVGAILGGVVAMLVAPKTGMELRYDMAEKGREMIDRARGKTSNGNDSNVSSSGIA